MKERASHTSDLPDPPNASRDIRGHRPSAIHAPEASPDSSSFRPGERIFPAQEIEHRTPDPVSGVGPELEPEGRSEAVDGLNQADCTRAD